MLVHGWSGCYGGPGEVSGRRSRSGWRSRPGGESGHKHLRSRRPVAQRGMRADRIVMPSPAFDHDLSLPQLEWLQGQEEPEADLRDILRLGPGHVRIKAMAEEA